MWDQIAVDKVQACVVRPLFTIDQVVERLEEMSEALAGISDSGGQNPVQAFNDIYIRITRRTQENIVGGTYADPAFVEILAVEFATLYFGSLGAWTRGVSVPTEWKQLFVLEREGQRHSNFEGALLGVIAHINRDLTYALLYAESRASKTVDWQCRSNDFALVSDVFIGELDPIVNGLIESLSNRPWKFMWKFINACLGGLDERMMFQAIVQFRSRAWKRAENFWKTTQSFEPPAPFERSRLSAHVANLVLHSHTFDQGPTSSPSRPLTADLEAVLPTVGEILVGSDILSIEYSGPTMKITSPNRRIGGHWEGKAEDLYTLFGSSWLAETLAAEPGTDIESSVLARTFTATRLRAVAGSPQLEINASPKRTATASSTTAAAPSPVSSIEMLNLSIDIGPSASFREISRILSNLDVLSSIATSWTSLERDLNDREESQGVRVPPKVGLGGENPVIVSLNYHNPLEVVLGGVASSLAGIAALLTVARDVWPTKEKADLDRATARKVRAETEGLELKNERLRLENTIMKQLRNQLSASEFRATPHEVMGIIQSADSGIEAMLQLSQYEISVDEAHRNNK